MKLINAEFVINKIKEQSEEITVDTLISWLENITIESEVITWHKVEDETPKKYGMYLVTLNKRNTDFCEWYPDKQQFGFCGSICDEVTAWAYLPKPCSEYEEVRDGNS